MKEVLEDLGFSIALFKAERKEKLRREKEALSLLQALVKRAKKERVVISLSSGGNCPPLVIEWGRIATGEQHPLFVSLKELMKEGGQFVLLRKRVFSVLYLALEGKVEVKIE